MEVSTCEADSGETSAILIHGAHNRTSQVVDKNQNSQGFLSPPQPASDWINWEIKRRCRKGSFACSRNSTVLCSPRGALAAEKKKPWTDFYFVQQLEFVFVLCLTILFFFRLFQTHFFERQTVVLEHGTQSRFAQNSDTRHGLVRARVVGDFQTSSASCCCCKKKSWKSLSEIHNSRSDEVI